MNSEGVRGTSLVSSWLRRTASDLGMELVESDYSSVLAVLHEIDRRIYTAKPACATEARGVYLGDDRR
jgi:hypothetical protein